MSRKMMDCREFPSESKCTLTIAGEEDEVLRAAVLQCGGRPRPPRHAGVPERDPEVAEARTPGRRQALSAHRSEARRDSVGSHPRLERAGPEPEPGLGVLRQGGSVMRPGAGVVRRAAPAWGLLASPSAYRRGGARARSPRICFVPHPGALRLELGSVERTFIP